jgi:hypothetical protein
VSGFVGSPDGLIGSADGASIAATSLSTDLFRAMDTSVVILSPERGQPTVLLKRLQIERLPGHGKGFAVRLRFFMSSPARVTFSVFGPAPSCSVAGRFTIAGHAGLNKVAFRGRIRGRLLPAGIYTIVPQATARSASLKGPRVAIMIDARGVHPTARMPWENCRSATKAEGLPSFTLIPSITPRFGGVKGAIATEPAVDASAPEIQAGDSLEGLGISSLIFAVLLSLVVITLLGLAAVELPYTATRFRVVRMLATHRGEVALTGAGLLGATAFLFLLSWLLPT